MKYYKARSFHVTVQALQDIFKSQQYPVSNSCRFKPSTGVPALGGSQVGFTSDNFKGLAMIPEKLPNQITLWTILLERFTMKFWEGSTWHRFRNSSWHDWIFPWHQDRAAWGTVWLIFDMVNFACTIFSTQKEVQLLPLTDASWLCFFCS